MSPQAARHLEIEDAGPPSGFPLIVSSGSPGSRILDPRMVESAARHGLRPIGFDRPGYGGSPPAPGRTMADGGGDVAQVAAELGLERIVIWGFSGGGDYALAAAARHPELVAGACVIATFGPYGAPDFDFCAGVTETLAEEVDLYFGDEQRARQKWRDDVDRMVPSLTSPEGRMARWGALAGTDEAHDLERARYLAANCAEALRSGDEGWWEDWVAVLQPWGFDLSEVTPPVRLWHGTDDQALPVNHGRYIASRLPNVIATFPEGLDHSGVEVRHREEGLAWLAEVAAGA